MNCCSGGAEPLCVQRDRGRRGAAEAQQRAAGEGRPCVAGRRLGRLLLQPHLRQRRRQVVCQAVSCHSLVDRLSAFVLLSMSGFGALYSQGLEQELSSRANVLHVSRTSGNAPAAPAGDNKAQERFGSAKSISSSQFHGQVQMSSLLLCVCRIMIPDVVPSMPSNQSGHEIKKWHS